MNKGIKKKVSVSLYSLLRQYSTQISSASPSVQQVTSGEPCGNLLPAAGREGSERPPQFLWSSAFFFCLFSRARLTSPSSPCERRWPRRAPRLWSAGRPRSLGTPRWSEPAAPRCSSAGLPAHKSRRSDLQSGPQMLSEDSRSSCDSQPRDHLFRLVQFHYCLD